MNSTGPHEFRVYSLAGWDEFAGQLLTYAGKRRTFFLYGEMGAGKTTLTQAVCRFLGAEEGAVSPSFALVNEYHYQDEKGLLHRFYHLDLFRLKDEQEALDIGIEDYLYGGDYCFVEWPDLVEGLAPEDVVRIQITSESESVRKVLFL